MRHRGRVHPSHLGGIEITEYQLLRSSHVEPAAELVLAAYREEKQAVPCLPGEDYFHEVLRRLLASLFARGSGYAAIRRGKLAGFLAGIETGELWGRNKGIYSPLYGHGAIEADRADIYRGLYTKAAQMWVEKKHYTHALTFFAHDQQTIDTWFWLGFGLRCIDSIRRVQAITVDKTNSDIVIRKGTNDDIPGLRDIMDQFSRFWPQSPTFMQKSGQDPVEKYNKWFKEPNRHFWVAYQGGRPVAQIRIQPVGESFISEHPDIVNVTSAYVAEAGRSTGIGLMLLAKVQQWLMENHYPLCGVDFESFNIPGSRFWNRYFTPYTYSLVRRVDERI